MKKFIVYEWHTDDEGGFGICLTNNYSDDINNPLSDMTRDKIGEFDTVMELTSILYQSYPDYYNNAAEAYEEDAKHLFNRCICLED